MSARTDGRRKRRETVVLALLAHRPGGWSMTELQAHTGGLFATLQLTLDRLEAAGKVRAWFEDGPYPRRRLYDVARGCHGARSAGASGASCGGSGANGHSWLRSGR